MSKFKDGVKDVREACNGKKKFNDGLAIEKPGVIFKAFASSSFFGPRVVSSSFR